MTRVLIVAIALLACGWRVHAATEQPCDPQLAEEQSFSIAEITRTSVPFWIALPLEAGKPFRQADAATAGKQVQERLDQESHQEGPARFRLVYTSVACRSMDKDARTVSVDVRADRIVIPEGATAGELIDDANPNRLEVLQGFSTVSARHDYDSRLGNIVGADFQTHAFNLFRPLENGSGTSVGRTAFGAWQSVDHNYYRIAFDATSSSWLYNPRGVRGGLEFHAWIDRIPFSTDVLSSKGAEGVAVFEKQSGSTDLRADVGARIEAAALDSHPEGLPEKSEITLRARVQQEFTTRTGFVRAGGWYEMGTNRLPATSPLTASALRLYAIHRGMVFLRMYSTLGNGATSWMIDASGTFAASGAGPFYRTFVGGNRLDPFLAERIQPGSEYRAGGPVLRGYGNGGFALKRTGGLVESMRYAGISLTIGLPGLVRPIVEPVDPNQQELLQGALQNAFDIESAQLMTERTREGEQVPNAARGAAREGLQLRHVMENVFKYGHRMTLRPLIVLDTGGISGDDRVRASSIGGGLRLAGLSWGAELLVIRNVGQSGDIALPSGGQVVSRIHFRTGFHKNAF
jgi:hypothetical protein